MPHPEAPRPVPAAHPRPDRPIVLLATGGTISCTHNPDGSLTPDLSATQLAEQAGLDVEGHDILHVDSSCLTLADIDHILAEVHRARRAGAHRVILTHGTDTLEETAMALDRLLPAGGPVVLTGAQRPADDPRPDGPANLRAAAEVEAPRPTVCFGGSVFPAYGVTKVHTTSEAGFANPGFGPVHEPYPGVPDSRFAGAEAPTAGSATPQEPVAGAPLPPVPDPLVGANAAPPSLAGLTVPIVTAFAGADDSLIPAPGGGGTGGGMDGLVIVGLGSGNIPAAMMPGVQRVLDSGIPVTICTRVPAGGVHLVYGSGGGGHDLAAAGARSGGLLSPAQARMEMLCELAVRRAADNGVAPGRL